MEDCSEHELRRLETPSVDRRMRRTISDGSDVKRRRLRASRSIDEVYDGAIPCRQLHVHENSQLEINPLWRSQPVQLPKKRSNVSELRRGKHKPRGRVHHRLKLLKYR